MSPDKLVRMANQIATFFESQPGDDQADRVARHLADFWDTRMRSEIQKLAENPECGLSPLARRAVDLLKTHRIGA